jgi:uncharacterized membrane protein
MELIISRILRSGVVASAIIISSGLIWFLVRHLSASSGDDGPDLVALAGAHDGAMDGASQSLICPGKLITLGIIVLLCTPAIRVFASAYMFMKQKDWAFAVMTIWVILSMIAGLVASLL